MSADHLHRFIVNHHDQPAWRGWYGRQFFIAQGLLRHASQMRGNCRIGPQDARDIVHDAIVLVREDQFMRRVSHKKEDKDEIKPILPMSADEATDAFVPFMKRAISKLHGQTRLSRAAKPPAPGDLAGADPRTIVEADQVTESLYFTQLVKNAEAQTRYLIQNTNLDPDRNLGEFLILQGSFVSRGCDVKDMAEQLGTTKAGIHQYRSRSIVTVTRLLDASRNGPAKNKPPSDE